MRAGSSMLCVAVALLLAACSADGESATDPAGSGGVASTGGSGGGGAGGASGSAGTTGFGGGGTSASGGAGGGAAAAGVGGAGGASGGAGGAAGVGGSAGGCVDPGPEPNDSLVLATPACGTPICELGDCDKDGSTGYGGDKPSIKGVVQAGDLDHFRFDGKDNFGLCQVNAAAKTQDSGFRLCLFVSCKLGASKVTACPGGLAVDTAGAPGCCVYTPKEVNITYDCTGSPSDDDSARITIRVDEATACTPYTIDYHF